uniref:NR LBD domain-containing protein n=1 Tax=Caenorhabditis japonica TaxID=281687 RepID=A0A8R1DPT4_CAEJA
MVQLDNKDKLILLKSFCVKASLFAGAMRAKREGRDRLLTVDGRDVYPDNLKRLEVLKIDIKSFSLTRLEKFPEGLLHRIRSLLVCRLIELKVTSEEFALLNVILCCNPGMFIDMF